jgi:4-carboxymuconolactone decarboxylase
MPRIDYASLDIDPALIERIKGRRGGTVPNVYRMLLNSPSLTEGWVELANRVRFASSLDGTTRELIVLLVARLTNCAYEWNHHLDIALRAGASPADIDVVGRWPVEGAQPAVWPPAEAFASADGHVLRFVAAMATRTDVESAGLGSWIREVDRRAVTEVAVTAAYYLGLAHLILALGVDSEGEGA